MYVQTYVSLLNCFHPEISFVLDLQLYNGNTKCTLSFHKSRLGKKLCCLFCQFYYHMRIINIICISKENAVRHYIDLIFKVFEENFEITQGAEGEGGVECQLRTSKRFLLKSKFHVFFIVFAC